ncbi:MAG: hypothetical protein QNJ17_15650 [Desulfocapsaceae bacterium]|nr:hypothetical protein [Desulfocapsaceae bacterium]
MEAQERRDLRRYRTKERALLAVGPEKEDVFHLLDINEKGAGFRYMGRESRTSRMRQVDLYFQDALWLRNVKVSLVQDNLMLNGMIPFRRCGLRFEDLSEEQTAKLESFVKKISAEELA